MGHSGQTAEDRRKHFDEPLTVTLPRRAWTVILAAAESYDRRVPPDQGDGWMYLDVIREAINRGA